MKGDVMGDASIVLIADPCSSCFTDKWRPYDVRP